MCSGAASKWKEKKKYTFLRNSEYVLLGFLNIFSLNRSKDITYSRNWTSGNPASRSRTSGNYEKRLNVVQIGQLRRDLCCLLFYFKNINWWIILEDIYFRWSGLRLHNFFLKISVSSRNTQKCCVALKITTGINGNMIQNYPVLYKLV